MEDANLLLESGSENSKCIVGGEPAGLLHGYEGALPRPGGAGDLALRRRHLGARRRAAAGGGGGGGGERGRGRERSRAGGRR